MVRSLIVGLVAGWLTGTLMRGRGYGVIVDILLGLIGGVIGGWIFADFGITAYGFIGGVAMSTVGAVALVGAVHLLRSAA
ncbi:MAG: GlsB/YeaQ/YmgE family stress response membrane protein [Candidatus Binataceae bacterium]